MTAALAKCVDGKKLCSVYLTSTFYYWSFYWCVIHTYKMEPVPGSEAFNVMKHSWVYIRIWQTVLICLQCCSLKKHWRVNVVTAAKRILLLHKKSLLIRSNQHSTHKRLMYCFDNINLWGTADWSKFHRIFHKKNYICCRQQTLPQIWYKKK